MRQTCLPAACVLIGVAVAGPAPAQFPNDPRPVPGPGTGGAKVYMPTVSPYPGTLPPSVTQPQGYQPAPQPQQWPQPAAPQPAAPQPAIRPAAVTPNWPAPPGQVVPASATGPTPPAPLPAMTQPAPAMVPPGGLPAAVTPPAPAPVASPLPMPPPPASPGVSVEKRGPEIVNLSQLLAYEIVVRNPGPAPVYQVRVEDELPAGARFIGGDPTPEVGPDRLAWTLNTLDPGTERRLQVQVQLGAEGEVRSTATVHYMATAGLRTRVVQPRLTLAIRGPEQATAGDTVPFHIVISNPGSGPVTNLLLRGKLPDGLTHPQGQIVEAEIGTLGPGESRNVTLAAQAARGGQYVTELTATGDGGLEARAQAAVQVLGPTLQLARSGPAKCYLKSEVGFELELANTGSGPAGHVEIADALPPGLDFVSATDGGMFDPATRTIIWRLPALLPAGKQRVGYRVKAMGLGELPDRAAARADRGPDVRADGTFTVEGIPALALEVVDLEDPIEVGSDLTYEIRVVNQGSCPCTNIQITAQVPDGLLAREGTGPTAYRANGPQVAFEPLPKLAVKADAVYRVKVRGLQPGDYRFRAQMTCDQLRQPVLKEEASRVYKDGL